MAFPTTEGGLFPSHADFTLVGSTSQQSWLDPDFPQARAFYKVTAVSP